MAWDLHDLFRRHSRDVNRYLQRRVSSKEVAADLTQDLFLRLLTRQLPDIVSDRKGYLLRAASNLAINHNKRERLISFGDPNALNDVADDTPSAERILLSRQELYIVASVLAEIPPVQREIFILSRLEGWTFDAIGKRLGMPLQTVHGQMARVLTRLQLRFEALNA